MLKIMLVRHGVTDWNTLGKIQGISDTHLSPDGLHQARLLAAHCPFEKADAIYSSDLARAKTTALVLSNKFNLPVTHLPELRETNFGDWEGNFFREMVDKDPENFKAFFEEPEKLKINNGETFLQTQVRAMNALKKIISVHEEKKDSHVIIVSHGSVNRCVLCAILEMPLKKMWAITQFNTGVNILRVIDGNISVELMNGTAHLKGI